MPKDIVTASIAQLGLINGAIVIAQAPGEPLKAAVDGAAVAFDDPEWSEKNGRDFSTCGFVEYMPSADLYHVADCVAEALSEASLSAPDAYGAVVSQVSAAGTSGYILLRPPKGSCPDAAAIVPWLDGGDPPKPSARCFPSVQMLDAVSMIYEGGTEEPDAAFLDQWCAGNPDHLLMLPGPAGSIVYHGWNASMDRRCSVHAELVDFSKPWRAMPMPDGSEGIVPALPLRLADDKLNCWEPI